MTPAAGQGDPRAPDTRAARPHVGAGQVRRGAGTPDPERGSGTVLVLALVAAAVTGLLTLSLLASAQSGRSAAQSAADLAALAVAGHVAGGSAGDPGPVSAASGAGGSAGDERLLASACAVGRATAEANGCLLTSCDGLGAGVVEVTASRRTVAGVARAVARAGPLAAP